VNCRAVKLLLGQAAANTLDQQAAAEHGSSSFAADQVRRLVTAPRMPLPGMQPLPPNPLGTQPRSSVWDHIGEFFRYTSEGWRGVGV
jgi:hypothetical protein